MQPGRLRHRVTFEEQTIVQDSDGEIEESWNDAFGRAISCEITPLSGKELMAAQAVQSKVATRIKTRHRPGLNAAMRAVHRDVVYSIEAVVPDPKSGINWVTLFCSSGVQYVNEE